MATITLYRLSDVVLENATVEDVFSSAREMKEVALRRGIAARLFVFRSEAQPPEWVGYLEQITARPLAIRPREGLGAVLLLKSSASRRTVYAATWGAGHFVLRGDKIQPDVGLRTALNLLAGGTRRADEWQPERIRAIRTKRVGQTTLISQTQASRKMSIETFPFSVSADQLRQVTGSPADSVAWGSTITGGVSLHVRRPDQAQRIAALCTQIDNVSRSTAYKAHYGWVDNVAPVSDQRLSEKVVTEIVGRLRAGDVDGISVSPPELIEWGGVAKFVYQWGRRKGETAEPSIAGFLEFVREQGLVAELSSDELATNVRLLSLNDDGEKVGSWPLLKCLTAEGELGGRSFILDEGALFVVDRTYLATLNGFVAQIPAFGVALPGTLAGENEGPYNERLASTLNSAFLLDKKTVTRPQATAVEICDVALGSRKLIHVKKGLSSSSLSHLFAQGVISAELLRMDDDFRRAVGQLLARELGGQPAAHRARFEWLYESPFAATQCEVAYVIMTGLAVERAAEKLPFFSKVNLRLRCDELRRMGFSYSLGLVGSAGDGG